MEQAENNYSNEITLRDYTRMVFRHWPVFVTSVVVVLGTVFVGLKLKTPVYEARVKMLISSEKETQAPYSREIIGYDKSQLNLTQSEIVKSAPVLERTVKVTAIPMQPEGRSKKLILALALVMGIFLGLILSFIFESLDQTVRSPGDLLAVLGIPIVAKIPHQSLGQKTLVQDSNDPAHPYMVAYHELACQIRFFFNQKKMKVFLFTAPDGGEGTTTVVSNLGLCLAKDFKKKVLIIDTHYHHPGVHKNFQNLVSPGLVEVLSGKLALSQATREVTPNLWILAAGDGQADLENFLDSQKMAEVLKEAKENFEIILIDCADLRHHRDAISQGNFVDGIVLVVSEGKTRRPAIAAVAAPLKGNNFNIVGAVLNNRTFALPQWVYERI